MTYLKEKKKRIIPTDALNYILSKEKNKKSFKRKTCHYRREKSIEVNKKKKKRSHGGSLKVFPKNMSSTWIEHLFFFFL